MIKTTYTYAFTELNGKPKRFLESKTECRIMGYGVSTDTVTLSVSYDNADAFNKYNKMLFDNFKVVLQTIELI